MQLDPIERVSFTLSAGAVGAAVALAPPPFAAGVAVGALLEAVNLRAQVRAARVFFSGERPEKVGAGPWIGGFSMRFGLMAVGVVAALSLGIDPAGLLVGLSLAMPAVVVWAWRNRPEVLEHAPAPALAPDDPSWDRWSIWRAGEVEPDPEADEPFLHEAASDDASATGHDEGDPLPR